MDYSKSHNLDVQFSCFVKLLNHFLNQIDEEENKNICNAWVMRLTKCERDEKTLRNRYVFKLCKQIAAGVLEEPFLEFPKGEKLQYMSSADEMSIEESSLDLDITDDLKQMGCSFNSEHASSSSIPNANSSKDVNYLRVLNKNKTFENMCLGDMNYDVKSEPIPSKKYASYLWMREACLNKVIEPCSKSENYAFRTNNLILKLRDIKNQNMLLHTEIHALKQESVFKSNESQTLPLVDSTDEEDEKLEEILKNSHINKNHQIQQSLFTIKKLKEKLKSFEELKQQEINGIVTKYKHQLEQHTKSVKLEVKESYEKRIEEIKKHNENISKLHDEIIKDLKHEAAAKDFSIKQKDSELEDLTKKVAALQAELSDQKNKYRINLDKLEEKITDREDLIEKMNEKCCMYDKKLSQLEKSKRKTVKTYELKLFQALRDKRLAECSLQLQLVKQRAQTVTEMTDENQTEITRTVNKLEATYRDIIANMQATVIERKMQDQEAFEKILQVVYNLKHGDSSPTVSGAEAEMKKFKFLDNNHLQVSRSPTPSPRSSREDSDKMFKDEQFRMKITDNCCLDNSGNNSMFHRVYTPQKDT